jgi:sulfur relay protein TusB/DsrH
MTRVCLLITKLPKSIEDFDRIFGLSQSAKELKNEVVVYFLGDSVLCTKNNQKGFLGKNMKIALENGVELRASAKDLRARAITKDQVETGVDILEDFEDEFVEDMMEKSDRVISW